MLAGLGVDEELDEYSTSNQDYANLKTETHMMIKLSKIKIQLLADECIEKYNLIFIEIRKRNWYIQLVIYVTLKHSFLSQVPSFQYYSCQTLNSYLTHLAHSKLTWAPVGLNTCSRAQCTCIHIKSLQVCLTFCNPMDGSLPSSSVHGILQARILGWVAMSSSRGASWPRDLIHISMPPALAGRFLTTNETWEAPQSLACVLGA